MSTNTPTKKFPETSYGDVIVIIRRYDQPEVSYGLHEWAVLEGRWQEIVAPLLVCEEAKVDYTVDLIEDGLQPLGTKWLDDQALGHLVRRSCPIEFHEGLRHYHPSIVGRIQVWGRPDEDLELEPELDERSLA